MIKGFDSWGALSFPEPTDYKFAYFNFNNFTAPATVHKYYKQQTTLAKQLGYLRGGYAMWRFNSDPVTNGQWVASNYQKMELPLALDFEDKYATKGVRTVESIAKYGKAITDAGVDVIIYTGKWWWDVWVAPYHSYFDTFGWSPYDYPLWECDPDPDTALPGLGKWAGKDVMRQRVLDWAAPGFDATIDVDYAHEAWFNQYTNPTSPKTFEATINVPGDAERIVLTLNRQG